MFITTGLASILKTVIPTTPVFLAYALLVGCESFADRTTANVQPKDVQGAWLLETVHGQPPGAINIKFWRVEFSANQQWAYSGEMTGQFAGMQVSGSGSWTITAGLLQYTAGASKGQSRATIQHGILTLSPDPVVMLNGKTPTTTTYKRVKPEVFR